MRDKGQTSELFVSFQISLRLMLRCTEDLFCHLILSYQLHWMLHNGGITMYDRQAPLL